MLYGRVSLLLVSMFAISLVGIRPAISAPPGRDAAGGRPQPAAVAFGGAAALTEKLVLRYGADQRARIGRGLEQVRRLWRAEDGDQAAFEAFVLDNYAGNQKTLDTMFDRFSRLLEQLDGHMSEIRSQFRLQTDLDRGPVLPLDEIFAAYEPTAHVSDNFFANKLAFVVLLNFPLTTAQGRQAEGEHWTRRQWAEAGWRAFSNRVPADVVQAITRAQAAAELYINQYNICAHHLLDADGRRPFPAKLRLLPHWNVRDEIKAQYAGGAAGLANQRLLERVLERIVDQSIPAAAINDPRTDWCPLTNQVSRSPVSDLGDPAPEDWKPGNGSTGDARYAMLLAEFRANAKADPYYPMAPTFIIRSFDEGRQMSEARVQGLLQEVLTSPQFAAVGRLIEKQLGRPLEPLDIWYNGFLPRQKYTEAQLDAMTRARYPTADVYHADMAAILVRLGFRPERAAFLRDHIDVEPSRGPGHAMGGSMRGQHARLRTRVEQGGMNYKGFNIAVHEMGHNCEQTFSLNEVDYTLLAGVPNNAFTEALAMMLQGHDLEVLGLAKPDARSEALRTLNDFWATAEIAGVGLVDMAVWHWMYDHPSATPAELKDATLRIARETWNRYYAPVFPQRDVTLLAVYSHAIADPLYLPDYPIGHLIGYQVEEHINRTGRMGDEFERITKFGNVAPDLWMKNATGALLGAGRCSRPRSGR